MKKKDLITLSVAVLILLVGGYLAYTKLLAPQSSTNVGVTVPVIGSIPSKLDDTALQTLTDPTKTTDYTPVIDLTTGLGNPTPFGK